MIARAVSIVVAALLAVVMAQEASIVPLLMWSGQPYFANERTTIGETLDASDVQRMVSSIIAHQHSASSPRFLANPVSSSSSPRPEIVLAFVFAELNSAQLSQMSAAYAPANSDEEAAAPLAPIKAAFNRAAASLTAPFVNVDTQTLSDDIEELHTSLAPRAQIVGAQLATMDDTEACQALLTDLDERHSSHDNIFANREPDLILVKYQSTTASNTARDSSVPARECLTRLIQNVATRTNGQYLALVTADEAPHKQLSFESVANARPIGTVTLNAVPRFATLAGVTYATTPANYTYPGVTKINPSILLGLLIGFFLLFVLLLGANCVASIQTPPRFSTVSLPLSKEY